MYNFLETITEINAHKKGRIRVCSNGRKSAIQMEYKRIEKRKRGIQTQEVKKGANVHLYPLVTIK